MTTPITCPPCSHFLQSLRSSGTSHEPLPKEPYLLQHLTQLANSGLKQPLSQPSPNSCLQLIGTVSGLVHPMTLLQQLEKFFHRHTRVWGATQSEDFPQEYPKRPPTEEHGATVNHGTGLGCPRGPFPCLPEKSA